jgi:hypothetical protein
MAHWLSSYPTDYVEYFGNCTNGECPPQIYPKRSVRPGYATPICSTEKYEKITGKKPLKREFRSKKEYSLHKSVGILGLFELLWIFVGFFTGNWYLFGITLALSYLLNIILKPFKFSILHKLISFTFLLSRLCLYLYLIVNHFYLHQDTYIIVKHYIKW